MARTEAGHQPVYRVAVIPGDGTGPEVIREGLKVLDAAASGFEIEPIVYDIGGERYLRTGETLPPAVLEELRNVDAIYFGAVGHPDVPPGILERGLVIRIRFELDQYVNLRPVRLLPGWPLPSQRSDPTTWTSCSCGRTPRASTRRPEVSCAEEAARSSPSRRASTREPAWSVAHDTRSSWREAPVGEDT